MSIPAGLAIGDTLCAQPQRELHIRGYVCSVGTIRIKEPGSSIARSGRWNNPRGRCLAVGYERGVTTWLRCRFGHGFSAPSCSVRFWYMAFLETADAPERSE